MTEREIVIEWLRAKIDSQRDPMLLNEKRLSAAVRAMSTADSASWAVAMGYIGGEEEQESADKEGTPNDGFYVACATIAAANPKGPIKFSKSDASKPVEGNTVDASEHFKALKKQADANKRMLKKKAKEQAKEELKAEVVNG